PSDVGLDIGGTVDLEKTTKIIEEDLGAGKAISFWKALMIPGVIEFSIAQFFIKLVSYTFLYWLPLFLKETTQISPSKSAYVSIIFDIGGCVGSMAAGLMADRTGTSALTCIFFLIFAIPSLYSLDRYTSASTILISQVLQFTTGMLINGPFCLIMSTVSANLACKVPSKSAMATVSGIVNGTGSIGASIGPLLAGIVSKNGNWKNVFYMAIGSVICAAISLLRIGYQEVKTFKK
ncbi:PREDICTED: glucose-6-phosphate exchanger SLC37A2-like, partial [Rhagoletis zephyria]|uniref:glucose-6-phosphate exchanger SLC37A2-like n=1 Tax=Rhagoletis zephyria TaxID=28612 RepID=UPI00081164E7